MISSQVSAWLSGRGRQRTTRYAVGIGDMGMVHPSHPPLAQGLGRAGKGIEEPTMGPGKGSSGFGNSLQRYRAVTS